MADFSIKAHDQLPTIRATLSADLTSATSIKFIMVSATDGSIKVKSPAVIVAAASGTVRYDWIAPDTDAPGSYRAEWEVTWSDGKKQTFPTLTYHTIDVLADLDGV